MRNSQRSRVTLTTLIPIVGLLFAWLGAQCAFGQTSPGANPNRPSIAASQAREASSPPKQSLPSCPSGAAAALSDADVRTGHHTVILSWNANPKTGNPVSDAVGYCLYRSEVQYVAKQNPLCQNCEQINLVPVVGTACVDSLVKDTAKYYYVVTAINAVGETSSPSTEAPATIPNEKEPGSVSADFPLPPSCRSASGAR